MDFKNLVWEGVDLSADMGKDYVGNLSFARDGEGRTWVTWDCFMTHQRKESIVARCWDGEELSRPYTICKASTCCMPQVTTDFSGNVWVFWASRRRGRWDIYTRVFDGLRWQKELTLTSNGDNFRPSVGTDSKGRIWVVWECHEGQGSLVKAKNYGDGTGSREIFVSPFIGENFRPQVCMGKRGEVYVVWDAYSEGTCNIYARGYVNEEWSDIQQVSRDDHWEFMPSVTVDGLNRLWVAWLCSTDVTNADGVIDQWPTIRCAHYDGVSWHHFIDQDGTSDMAFLGHGLLPKVSPKTGVWGYLGRRRQPMLIADEQDGVWLLWERKEKHDSPTITTTGLLCGRFFDGEKWSKAVVLHSGQVFYVTSNNTMRNDGKIWICAKEGRYQLWPGGGGGDPLGIQLWFTKMPTPEKCEQLPTDEWVGWAPVCLSSKAERMNGEYSVNINGVRYRLYWGDPHCHSVLSADAEGEIDEILHYARDKAGLDFCVVTDNDFMYLPMSSSAWAIDQHYSEEFNAPGKFVVFSGYEWSARNPINHRSIIYMTSDQPIFRWTEQGSRNIEELKECIKETNGIMHAHHQTWHLSDSPRECNVEVCSGWDIYIDDPECVHRHLAKGYIFGFIGGSDSHRRNPGLCGALTGVYAREFTRESILEAIKTRRCYATNGSRIFLDFRINDAFMGERCQIEGNPKIQVHVIGTRRLLQVELCRNGEAIHSKRGKGKELRFHFIDQDCPLGESYYYVRVTEEGEAPPYPSNIKVAKGNRAWSSPIWVSKFPSDKI